MLQVRRVNSREAPQRVEAEEPLLDGKKEVCENSLSVWLFGRVRLIESLRCSDWFCAGGWERRGSCSRQHWCQSLLGLLGNKQARPSLVVHTRLNQPLLVLRMRLVDICLVRCWVIRFWCALFSAITNNILCTCLLNLHQNLAKPSGSRRFCIGAAAGFTIFWSWFFLSALSRITPVPCFSSCV